MAYNQKLANRIRAALGNIPNLEEKQMMGGLVFMVNDKMSVGIMKDEMMCRIDPDSHESLVEKAGCRTMELGGRFMKGYVLIDDSAMSSDTEINYWINLCLGFNSKARASKKIKK